MIDAAEVRMDSTDMKGTNSDGNWKCGFWPLAAGFWPLAFGFWPLAVGCWPLAFGCWLLAEGALSSRTELLYKRHRQPLDGPLSHAGDHGACFPGIHLAPSAGRILADKDTKGWTDEDYVDTFLADFDLELGEDGTIRNVLGDLVVISESLFRDHTTGKLKIDRGRARYVHLLADTIKDPQEVWRTWVDDGGKKRLVERYLKRYDSRGKGLAGIVVFDHIGTEWHGTTAFPDTSNGYTDRQRRSTLMYYKKKVSGQTNNRSARGI